MPYRIHRPALAIAALTATTLAHAATLDVAQLKTMPPAARAKLLQAQSLAKASARSRRAGDGPVDNNPPSLTSFAMKPPADVAAPFAQLEFDIKATDDQAGVISYGFTLTGPHGQSVGWAPPESAPETKFSQKAWVDVSAYLEPGVWTLTSLYLFDANQNYITYGAADLPQYGNVQVNIVNGKPKLVDYTPPTAVKGKVVTTSVSASSFAPGTNMPPYIDADFDVTDAGSGTYMSSAYWCVADESSCMSMSAVDTGRERSKATVHLWGQLGFGQQPGDYLLVYVSFFDFAWNETFLFGKDFGGDTDFSVLMPGGHTITVTP
jgi:hypothetical protein